LLKLSHVARDGRGLLKAGKINTRSGRGLPIFKIRKEKKKIVQYFPKISKFQNFQKISK
jgi:hypothetical protein